MVNHVKDSTGMAEENFQSTYHMDHIIRMCWSYHMGPIYLYAATHMQIGDRKLEKRDENRIQQTSLNHIDNGQYLIHPPTPSPTEDRTQAGKPAPRKIPFNDGLIYSEPIPQYFKENHPWEIDLVLAPNCPDNISVIRLIKTAPFNFEFRIESLIHHKKIERKFSVQLWSKIPDFTQILSEKSFTQSKNPESRNIFPHR